MRLIQERKGGLSPGRRSAGTAAAQGHTQAQGQSPPGKHSSNGRRRDSVSQSQVSVHSMPTSQWKTMPPHHGDQPAGLSPRAPGGSNPGLQGSAGMVCVAGAVGAAPGAPHQRSVTVRLYSERPYLPVCCRGRNTPRENGSPTEGGHLQDHGPPQSGCWSALLSVLHGPF